MIVVHNVPRDDNTPSTTTTVFIWFHYGRTQLLYILQCRTDLDGTTRRAKHLHTTLPRAVLAMFPPVRARQRLGIPLVVLRNQTRRRASPAFRYDHVSFTLLVSDRALCT